MKKLFYVKCILLIIALSSFSTTGSHSSFSKVSSRKFSCSMASRLTATKNYSQISFNWSGALGSTFSCGGYYNYIDPIYGNRTTSFTGGYVSTNNYTINVDPSASSVTFRVTTICPDGSTNTSNPASFTF